MESSTGLLWYKNYSVVYNLLMEESLKSLPVLFVHPLNRS